MNMQTQSRTELAEIAEDVARTMAQAVSNGAGHFIRTPVLYPSGSSVVVSIDGSRDRFFVSDFGYGHAEADMMGAALTFAHAARSIAARSGVSFDSRSFFIAEATRSELVGAVMAVADCSQRAVTETALKVDARKIAEDKKEVVDRLLAAFGAAKVKINAEVRGASAIEWPVLALVQGDAGPVIFDFVKPNRRSAANVAAKNGDFARLESPPKRIVAVRDKEEMGDLIPLLAQSASVIESSLSEVRYRSLAA